MPEQAAEGHRHTGQHWLEPERVHDFAVRMDARASERSEQFELMTQLLGRAPQDELLILDLGAGYGAEAQVFLRAFPRATAVLVDASAEMMRIGTERLAEFEGRYRYVAWDFGEGDLPDDVQGPFDAVISSAAIHHLPEAALQRLYRQIWERLAPEGAFLNIDLVRAPDEAIEARYRAIAEIEREARGEPAPDESRRHQSHLEPLESHLAWLRDADFEQVECFWKRLNSALFGGFRPVAPSSGS